MGNLVEYKRLTLHDYQEEDVEKLVRGVEMAALDATEMGGGKTVKAVETLLRRGDKRILIIAPLNTHKSWARTIIGQSNGEANVFVHPPGSSSSKAAEIWWNRIGERQEGWFILGWEAFVGKPLPAQKARYEAAVERAKAAGKRRPPRPTNLDWSLTGEWDAVVADECHRMANRSSMTWSTATTIIANSKYRLALSGTPARNKIEGYWAVLYWLWPHRFGGAESTKGYWSWVSKVCQTRVNPAFKGKEILGERYPGAAVQTIPLYIRRTLEEVATDLPPVIERRVEVPLMAGVQTRAYKEFEAHAFTWLEKNSPEDEEGDLPLMARLPPIHYMRLTQLALGVPKVTSTGEYDDQGFPVLNVGFDLDCKSNKITALKEIIGDIDPNEPVLVFTHSAKFARAVVHQLNSMRSGVGKAVALVDGTTHRERQEILDTFGREGGPRILVAGIAKVAEGTDGLQDVCRYEVWLSRHADNTLNQQAERRLWRPGQKRTVQRWILVSQDTVEGKVMERTDANAREMREAYASR